MNPILKIHEKDNVATCLRPVATGEVFDLKDLQLIANEDIPQFHKIALTDIPVHGPILKYGQIIGLATQRICRGDYVHVHNIESTRGRGDREGDAK
ncbi:UxaA family hydrolase [Anaerotignum sp.]|uniref:UxaA family hydrolase n=1 Tax=Anaerotignum sp. TaxID=2039241 RepID=UPI002714C263|nr:UxaA family hydrolase [Anaerotignum sp.]